MKKINIQDVYNKLNKMQPGSYSKLIGYLLIFTSGLFYATNGIHPRRAALVGAIGMLFIMINEFIELNKRN